MNQRCYMQVCLRSQPTLDPAVKFGTAGIDLQSIEGTKIQDVTISKLPAFQLLRRKAGKQSQNHTKRQLETCAYLMFIFGCKRCVRGVTLIPGSLHTRSRATIGGLLNAAFNLS
jgi:hypothetical protein